MTSIGLDKAMDNYNPTTRNLKLSDLCSTDGLQPSRTAHDTAHQPSFAFVPYLVTGDHYYLEELQFWTLFNLFASNSGYRELWPRVWVKSDQVRGQAWSLRTLGEVVLHQARDGDPLKTPVCRSRAQAQHRLVRRQLHQQSGSQQAGHSCATAMPWCMTTRARDVALDG